MSSEKQYYCKRHKVILHIPYCPFCIISPPKQKKKKSKNGK